MSSTDTKSEKYNNGNKSTDEELTRRVAVVFQLMVDGKTRKQIIQYVTKKTDWNVKERTIDRYRAEAKQLYKEHALKYIDFDVEFGKAVKELELLWKVAIKDKQYSAALGARKELNEMMKLKTMEIKIKRNDLTTEKEIEEHLFELYGITAKQLHSGGAN